MPDDPENAHLFLGATRTDLVQMQGSLRDYLDAKMRILSSSALPGYDLHILRSRIKASHHERLAVGTNFHSSSF